MGGLVWFFSESSESWRLGACQIIVLYVFNNQMQKSKMQLNYYMKFQQLAEEWDVNVRINTRLCWIK